MTEPFAKLSSERILGALEKMIGTLQDPRLELYLFFLEQLRPFTRGELLRSIRINVLPLSEDQLDRSLSYLHEKKFLDKRQCGKETLYFPVL